MNGHTPEALDALRVRIAARETRSTLCSRLGELPAPNPPAPLALARTARQLGDLKSAA